jgi:hypothetical protein
MYKFAIIQPESGYEVYVNLISSSAGRYLSRHPYVIGLIREALLPMQLGKGRLVIERDMGRNIGTTDIVKTSDNDSIYYAQPIRSEVFSRFAKNRYPQSSQLLTIIIERDIGGDYEIKDTWIGPSTPPFPGNEYETKNSRVYWQSHALVHDAQAIQSKSITKDCPY